MSKVNCLGYPQNKELPAEVYRFSMLIDYYKNPCRGLTYQQYFDPNLPIMMHYTKLNMFNAVVCQWSYDLVSDLMTVGLLETKELTECVMIEE